MDFSSSSRLWLVVSILSLSHSSFSEAAEQSFWKRNQLSGDWGGNRDSWSQRGFDFTFEYTGELIGTSGGISSGSVYQGLGYGGMDIDAQKAFGWNGTTLHMSTLWIHGSSPGQYAGDELGVSNIDAYDGLRLLQVFAEKDFGKLNLRIGNLLADEEFIGDHYSDTFVNDSFGQPAASSRRFKQANPRLRTTIVKIYDSRQFAAALKDPLADCLWVGFVPSREEMDTAHRLKKQVWLSLHIGQKRPDIWDQARASQMDGICTDWPLECRSLWRKGK